MRGVVVLISFLCLVTALAAPASAEAAKRGQKCRSQQSTTVKKNNVIRVYETDGTEGTRLWACLRRSGKKRMLYESQDNGVDFSDTYVDVQLSGWYVSYTTESSDLSCKAACPPGYSGQSFSIELHNMKRRKRRIVPVSTTPAEKVLARSGALAWIQRSPVDGLLELVVRDKSGQRVLSHATGVSGLKLSRSTIRWTADGKPQTYRLR